MKGNKIIEMVINTSKDSDIAFSSNGDRGTQNNNKEATTEKGENQGKFRDNILSRSSISYTNTLLSRGDKNNGDSINIYDTAA